MNHRFLLGPLILCSFFIQAQDIDSLRALVAKGRRIHDARLSINLDYLGEAYYQGNHFDSAIVCYREALVYNVQSSNDSLTGRNYNDLGVMFYKTGAWDSSIYYYKKGIDIYQRFDDPSTMAAMLLNLSMIYKDKGVYDKALDLSIRSAGILEKGESTITLASCYNNIGNIYYRLHNFNYALSFYHKSLAIRSALKDQRRVAQSYNNIAALYSDFKQYDSALNYFSRSLLLKRELNDIGGSSVTLNNMGDVSYAMDRIDEALEYYMESLQMKKALKNVEGECTSLNNLAKVYIRTGKYKQAKSSLDAAIVIARRLEMLEEIRVNYELRIALLKANGPRDELMIYMDSLLVVKDSLLTKDKAETLAELQTRYETDKKEQHIVQLERDKQLQVVQLKFQRLWTTGLIIGSTFLFVIALLAYNQYRISQRGKKKIELLLQELHHRVKNNLQTLSNVLSLQSMQLTDENAIRAVKSNESRVNAMALIHRKLYGGNHERSINIKEYIEELVGYLVHSYGYFGKAFNLDLKLEEISLDVDKAIPVGLVINEIISNAFKYAFDYHPDPRLSVNVALRKGSDLIIVIHDNGKGIADTALAKSDSSFGLQMVKILMTEMKGRWEVKSNEGTTFELIIPLS